MSFKTFWLDNIRDNWVKEVVSQGYAIEFHSRPSLQLPYRNTILPQEHHVVLWEEINQMLEKGAISEILQPSPGFYSTFFLVPKKDGGLRPVLNLKPLNKFIRVTKFKMCTPQKIIQTLHKGNWLASLDLKDAYFHVPIRNQHRPYLRFAFQDRIFQFNVLPFGISTAPRVFTKVLAPLVGFLHHKGIRLFPYLDDCLIVARSAPQLLHSINLVIETLAQAGFLINEKKSHPLPVQRLQFLGIELDSTRAMSFLPLQRARQLRVEALNFLTPDVTRPARQFRRLLGLMAATLLVVPYARLRMRPLQIYFNSQWKAKTHSLDHPIVVPQILIDHIRWWTDLSNLIQGLDWVRALPTRVLTTDASLSG